MKKPLCPKCRHVLEAHHLSESGYLRCDRERSTPGGRVYPCDCKLTPAEAEHALLAYLEKGHRR